jgi:heterotetrameric sarcosine oxidase delta subunit
MMLITCPCCGPRDQTEFTYGGDATLRRPDPATASQEEWLAYIYLRDNPKGPHREYWQHHAGCRSWLVVARDTLTHAIASTEAAGRQR